jgi:2-ketocyclohexanecarboxyl-CoA hydrolase
VEAWAADVNQMSPTALAIAKRSFNADSENIRGISFLGIQAVKHYYMSEESKEGVRAFNERRKPDFKKFL